MQSTWWIAIYLLIPFWVAIHGISHCTVPFSTTKNGPPITLYYADTWKWITRSIVFVGPPPTNVTWMRNYSGTPLFGQLWITNYSSTSMKRICLLSEISGLVGSNNISIEGYLPLHMWRVAIVEIGLARLFCYQLTFNISAPGRLYQNIDNQQRWMSCLYRIEQSL